MPNSIDKNLRRILDAFAIGVLLENGNRKVAYTNKQFLSIFNMNIEPEMLLGADCNEMAEQAKFFFKDPEKFEKDITRILAQKAENKEVVETADGRYLQRRYVPIMQSDEVEFHLWTYEDVTDITSLKQKYDQQRLLYDKILNEMPADIAVFDNKHRYVFVNKSGVKDENIRKWLIGKDDYEYADYKGLSHEVFHTRRALFNKALDTKIPVNWTDEYTLKDGSKKYILRIFYPVVEDNGAIDLVIGYGVDTTEQTLSALQIEKQRERYITLVNSLRDGVFQVNEDRKIVYYNQSFAELLNVTPEDIEQGTLLTSKNVHPEDIETVRPVVQQMFQQDAQPHMGTFRVCHGDEIKHLEYRVWPVFSPADGHSMVGRFSDITPQVEREQNLQAILDKEKELSAMKSNFIHITSHELRTPLSVILSSAEIVDYIVDTWSKGQQPGLDHKSFTSSIITEALRITDILNDLLIVGRIENGKLKFEPEYIHINNYIHKLAAEQYSPFKDGRVLKITCDCDIENMWIDISLMRHALTNLINNAFKYSEDRQAPELCVYNDEHNLYFRIKDYGIGIPENEIKNLFQSFYRASNVGNISGTGIGLIVVEHVAKVHKGYLEVSSELNKGSIFTLSISLNNEREN